MLRVTIAVARSSLRIAALRQHTPIAKTLQPLLLTSRWNIYNGNSMSRGMATRMTTAISKSKENKPPTARKSTAKGRKSTKSAKTTTRSTSQKEKAIIAKEQKKARAAQRAAEAKAKARAKTEAKNERLVARKKAETERKKQAREKAKEKARTLQLKQRERKKAEKEKEAARAEKRRLAALRRPLVKRPKSTWQIFLQEFMAKHKSEHGPTSLPESARLAKVEFVSLPQSQLEVSWISIFDLAISEFVIDRLL
ncbi:hypothetical protein V1515DRAFT_597585 [Lipomyces mesembrius]